jgi:hypothetical protein
MYIPPSNVTYYSWKAEPYARGTSSILTSCFITLTLCVSTAVHLNIPKYNKSADGTWRKVAWLFTAVLAPEPIWLWSRREGVDTNDCVCGFGDVLSVARSGQIECIC